MPNQVTLKPSNHVFTTRAGETILDGALREGFVISYGCRNGACGTCKGKLLSGEVDYGSYQDSALSAKEKSQGYALFCRAQPLGDVVIECREVGATRDIQIRTLPARVQKMERLAADIMRRPRIGPEEAVIDCIRIWRMLRLMQRRLQMPDRIEMPHDFFSSRR